MAEVPAVLDVYESALQPGAPRFFHEVAGEPAAMLGIHRNRVDLDIAQACVPVSEQIDVEAFVAEIALQLGVSRSKALVYVDIGMQLRAMPRLSRLLEARAHLPLGHLAVLARATIVLRKPESLAEVEERLAEFVIPSSDNDALRGIRSFHRFLQKVIEDVEPQFRPKDFPGEKEPALEMADLQKAGETIGFSERGYLDEVSMSLEKSRALEFRATLDAIAATAQCSRVEALTHLVRGTAEAKIVLNLYCPATEDRPKVAWLGGAGWLSEIATQGWIDRVTHVRLLADETVEGYAPSERQRAYVQGRDGTCRFPGCDVDATKCDIDHIEAYNHENPDEGAGTDTHNLHCLCRRHHNAKTAGLWSVERDIDGVEVWKSSTTGKELVSYEQGPLAGHGRYSFEVRGMKMAQTLAEHNERRDEILKKYNAVLDEARRIKEKFGY